MQSTHQHPEHDRMILSPVDGTLVDRPGTHILDDLGIPPADQIALKHQGFISEEYRKERGLYYKLRYRMQGKQRVVYLGKDTAVADRVRDELAALQNARRSDQQLKQFTMQAHKLLRESKRRLEVDLEAAGFSYHGFEIRKTRKRSHSAGQRDGPAVLNDTTSTTTGNNGG
jgi:hypothetical protein